MKIASLPLSPSHASPPIKRNVYCQKVYNFFKMIVLVIKNTLHLSNYKIISINTDKVSPELFKQLKKFEDSFTYPFSEQERFRIKHGTNGDYFAFFKQLGKVHCYVAICKKDETIKKMIDGKEVIITRKKGEIAAVACGILRTLRTPNGKSIKAWYICDLKVKENYQGTHLPFMFMQKAAWRFFQCPRGFGICMNPQDGKPKAAELWKKHAPISGSNTQVLNLYTLDAEQAKKYKENIETLLRNHGYMLKDEHLALHSTTGSKDYEIFNEETKEKKAWQLLHMRPSATEGYKPIKDGTHMISTYAGSPLDSELKDILHLSPSSTAQFVSYGMKNFDPNLITSNQI